MMITHISPAALALFLTCITTATTTAAVAVVGSTRNIVSAKEIAATSTSSSSEQQQQHRALMVGLNEMDCKESLETNDGSIVCTFRIMPSAVETSSSSSPNLIHTCMDGSNFCLTTEVYPYDQANHQQEAASNNPPPPLTTTTTTTTTKQQQQQQQDCPTYKPKSGSQCGGWIPTGANERNCMYGDNRCDCDGYGRSEASSIIWICDNDLFVAPPKPIVNVDATLQQSAAVLPPRSREPVIPSHSNRIEIPTPVNGPNCPSYMPSNGSACNWVLTNKFSSYQCGYLSGDEVPQLPGTFMMVCKCDSTDTFVCAPAAEEIYYGVQSF